MLIHQKAKGLAMMEVLIAILLVSTALTALLSQQARSQIAHHENQVFQTILHAGDQLAQSMMAMPQWVEENDNGNIITVRRYPHFLISTQSITGQNQSVSTLPPLPPLHSSWAPYHLSIFQKQLLTLPQTQTVFYSICLDRHPATPPELNQQSMKSNCRPLSRKSAARNITVIKIIWNNGKTNQYHMIPLSR